LRAWEQTPYGLDESQLTPPQSGRSPTEKRDSELSGAPAPHQSGHGGASPGHTSSSDHAVKPTPPAHTPYEQLHVRLSPAQMAKLAALAREQGLPNTGLVRLLVERGLAEGQPAPRSEATGRPATMEVGVATLIAAEEILVILRKKLFLGHEGVDYAIEAGAAAQQRLRATEKAMEDEP
jgi:hypothetical protein